MLVDHLDSGEILLNTRKWWVGRQECCYEFSRCWIAEVFESGQEGAVLLSRSIKYYFLVKYRWVVGPTVQKLCRCCILKRLMCNRRWSFYFPELRNLLGMLQLTFLLTALNRFTSIKLHIWITMYLSVSLQFVQLLSSFCCINLLKSAIPSLEFWKRTSVYGCAHYGKSRLSIPYRCTFL